MATASTVQAIRNDIERTGSSTVPILAVEYVTGVVLDDDDTFESAVAALVASKSWVTGYSIDWINRYVTFTGPYTEPGGP